MMLSWFGAGHRAGPIIAAACLISLAAAELAPITIDPPFGFLNQTNEFVVTTITGQVVWQCTTHFGPDSQSVFSTRTADGGYGCTIVPPPALTSSAAIYNASLLLVDSLGAPASNALAVPFVRLPHIDSLTMRQGSTEDGDSVVVSLVDADGLFQVLQTPVLAQLTVPTLGSGNGFTVQANVTSVAQGGAEIQFALDTTIPQGAYPVLVTLQGHALATASGVPVSLAFTRVSVSLSAARIPISALSATATPGALTLTLDAPNPDPVTVLLTLVRASVATLTQAPDPAGPPPLASYPAAPPSGPVELRAPSSAAAVQFITVTFPGGGGVRKRGIRVDAAGADVSAGVVLRVARVDGGAIDAVRAATLLTGRSADVPTAPRFEASGIAAVYRGEQRLVMQVTRSGAASLLPSVVAWTVSALDDAAITAASESNTPQLLLQALPNIYAPPTNLTAVFGPAAGSLVWAAGSTDAQRSVSLPIDWDAVPYSARWQLALQLSPIWNAQVAAPAAAASSTATALLQGFDSGSDVQPRSDVQGLVYGVAQGTCPPGGHRVGGGTHNIPVLANAEPGDVMRGIMLRSRPANATATATYVPPTPAFFQNVTDYAAVVQFGSVSNEVFIVVKDRPRHVRVVGCGAAFVTTADTAWTVSPDSDSPNNLTTLALAVPLPSLAPSCSLDIRICLLDRCTSASLAQYRVNVTQLENPALAQLASVQVTIHGQRTVLCAHASALDDARRQLEGREPSPDLTPAAAAVSALLVGQNATAAECGSHSVLSASVRGVADSMLTIDADPLYEGPPGTQLAIGQRLFVQQGGTAPPMRPSLSLKVAKDISEVAFPLAMRAGSAASNATKSDNIIVDVPVTLTLADGITSVQHLLKLGLYYSANVQHDTLVSVAKSEAESAPVQQMDLWPQDPMNSGDCRACPLGSWTYSVDAATCLRCEPGSCAPQNGLTQCLVCTPGSYSPIFGASICAKCLPGFYAPTHSAAACRLCPKGYTAATGGAATCATKIMDGVQIGVDYALAVYFTVMIRGTDLSDVPAAVGVDASPADVVTVLVTADTSQAFNITSSDIEVTRVQQVSARTLQVDVTANLGMHVPPDATQAEIEAALAVAQLSKDQGIGNLSWSRTTQALGADARIVEDGVTTQVRLPDEERPPIWPAVVFPILACLVVLGTFMMLRYRKVRDRLTLQPTASESMLPSSFNLSALLVATGIMRSDSVCSGPDTGYRPSVVELSDAPGHPRKRGGNGGDVEWKDDLV